jgi:hypothetical protein
MTEASQQAMNILRSTDNLQWYLISMLIFVTYIYINEIEKRNWSAVWLGISLWAFELIWEMTNGLILHFTQYAPLWNTPGNSAFLIYVGINVEICLMFAVGGLVFIKALPKDKTLKIMGVPNRLLIPIAAAITAVIGEVILYKAGILVWDWWFWRWPHLYLIFINYCGPCFALAWAHDNLRTRTKRKVARALLIAAVVCHLVFATILGWV